MLVLKGVSQMAKNDELVQGGKPSEMEIIKRNSDYLRGTIEEGLQDRITGAISEADNGLLKFHGSYQQDDRDIRNERRRQKLEPAYSFMIRVRVPGGVIQPEQWLQMDDIAQTYGGQTMRLTTRQTIQFHGIIKDHLKTTMQEINKAVMTSIAACGDVNRNVMCNVNPYQSDVYAEVIEWAQKLNNHFLPQTGAYHEIWLDKEKVVDSREPFEVEPIYGDVYLPRKFKIGIAVPPTNDVDVFSQDLGLIAILEDDQLIGFNISVGGGMGMTHGDDTTYPQIGRVIGFSPLDTIVEACEQIIKIQRDFGNRSDRKHARFKYTIDDRGVDWVKKELNDRLGWELEAAREYQFERNGDRLGWIENDGKAHFTLFIQSGRIKDTEGYELMTGLREIAKVHKGDFRLTPNQNVTIANVAKKDKAKINKLIKQYGLTEGKQYTALKRNSMACVAFPTCGLAMAESERYLPTLLDKIEGILDEAGLREEEIVIRMTGCPNGCARPALAELGFIGKAPGKYNMYLGGGFAGERLNKLYRENIGEEEILESLRPILLSYAKDREKKEHFGDYVVRAGYVKKVESGQEFHN